MIQFCQNTRAAQHLLHLGRKIGLSPSFLSFFRCFVMLNSAKNDTFSVVLLKFTFLFVLVGKIFSQIGLLDSEKRQGRVFSFLYSNKRSLPGHFPVGSLSLSLSPDCVVPSLFSLVEAPGGYRHPNPPNTCATPLHIMHHMCN